MTVLLAANTKGEISECPVAELFDAVVNVPLVTCVTRCHALQQLAQQLETATH